MLSSALSWGTYQRFKNRIFGCWKSKQCISQFSHDNFHGKMFPFFALLGHFLARPKTKCKNKIAHHFCLLKDNSTGTLQWLMEHFHVLLYLTTVRSLPTFVTVYMILSLLNPKNNPTTSILTRDIVSSTIGLVQCYCSRRYIVLAVPALYSICLHKL